MPCQDREAETSDAILLIEVAVSSLAHDRSTKLALYAEAGIPEYWVIDGVAESIDIHRSPHAGGYREVTVVTGAGRTVSPAAFPDVAPRLAEIFA